MPGAHDGAVDASALNAWVGRVRELAAEKSRSEIGDEYIGHLLAHSPADDQDGGWPHRVVRDIIDALASEKIEQGILIERFNMRGVTSRSLYDGGGQERALAAQARQWSKLAVAWPRTAKLLEEIAKSWEQHADWEDTRARQDEM